MSVTGSIDRVLDTDRLTRVPAHIGIIPDGNRRWALARGLRKEDGYARGLAPGLKLLRLCRRLGIGELTFYGFTTDNTRRAREQTDAFRAACVDAVRLLSRECAQLRVVGNTASPAFPPELLPYTTPTRFGSGGIRVNFLVNYGWEWDLAPTGGSSRRSILERVRSRAIPRLDLIVRWGGRRRLSGFLPLQSVYADFYVVDDYWPDYDDRHVLEALVWYQRQDVTLGG
jgi:undecaprenyl diphosphate synthase